MNTANTSDLRQRRRNQKHTTNHQNLFHSSAERKTQQHNSKKTNEKNKNEETKAITSSLLRTKQMMQNELQRVSDVTNTIQDDGKKIKNTRDEHMSMGDGVKGARYALVWLKMKEKEDVIIFWSAVTFFYAVALYVLWTRIRIPFLMW